MKKVRTEFGRSAAFTVTGTAGTARDVDASIPLAYKQETENVAVVVTSDDKSASSTSKLAERVGFEPTWQLPAYTLSRRVP